MKRRRSTDKGLRLTPQPDRIPEPEPCAVGIVPKIAQLWSWATDLFSTHIPTIHESSELRPLPSSFIKRTIFKKTLQHEMKHPDHLSRKGGN